MIIAFLRMNPFHHRLNPNKPSYIEGGEYNGYVAFDDDLPPSWQGKADFSEENVLDHMVAVHGGITFDESMSEILDEPIIPLTAIPEPEVLKNFRAIGFDTVHHGDTLDKWPIDKVKEETLRLMKQIQNLVR